MLTEKKPFLFLLCCIFQLLLPQASPQALHAQGFSSIDRDLEQLENLIANTLLNTEEQQKLLETLQQNLNESGNVIESYGNTITRQEQLLEDLQKQLNAMSEIYTRQSALSAKYEQSSKFWRTFTLIAVPTAAIISGSLVWAVSK